MHEALESVVLSKLLQLVVRLGQLEPFVVAASVPKVIAGGHVAAVLAVLVVVTMPSTSALLAWWSLAIRLLVVVVVVITVVLLIIEDRIVQSWANAVVFGDVGPCKVLGAVQRVASPCLGTLVATTTATTAAAGAR